MELKYRAIAEKLLIYTAIPKILFIIAVIMNAMQSLLSFLGLEIDDFLGLDLVKVFLSYVEKFIWFGIVSFAHK